MNQPAGRAQEGRGIKTLAIRLESDLHAQLNVLAQLQGSTITDEIRTAIEVHIERTRANPDLTAKATGALEDIERDAALRRDAIAALFGSDDAGTTASPASGRARKARGGTTSQESPLD